MVDAGFEEAQDAATDEALNNSDEEPSDE